MYCGYLINKEKVYDLYTGIYILLIKVSFFPSDVQKVLAISSAHFDKFSDSVNIQGDL